MTMFDDIEVVPTRCDMILSALSDGEISRFPDFVAAVRDVLDEHNQLINAGMCALGHLTGNMDGDMDLGNPVDMLRAALSDAKGPF